MRFSRWFDNLTIQKRLLASLSFPVLLMVLVSITVYNNTNSMVEDQRWVNHTHTAITRAHELLNLIIDMETGQRGYLITGNDDFLAPYKDARKVWDSKWQTLSQQVSDNPLQVERLKAINELYRQWLTMAGEAEINQRRLVSEHQASMQSVIDLIQSKTGKHLVDTIRVEIDQFISTEKQLNTIRTAKSEESAHKTCLTLVIGTFLSAGVSIIVAILVASRIKRRINRLVDATQQVSLGNLDKGASMLDLVEQPGGIDEISQLSRSFRLMSLNLVKNDKKMRDYTVKLKEESEKSQAAAKAKTDFLSTMSHEIRTPMNGVLGLSQIIANETKETSTKQRIDLILDSGRHLMTLLNDILDFSKVEENKLELENSPFKLAQIIEPVRSTIQPLVDEKNITLLIQSNIAGDIEFIGDAARLRQILFNLVGNAVKFTLVGHILIEITHEKEKEHLLISIKDTGIGIPQHLQRSIFNPFEQADTSTTRKFGGTGLGLAIVKQLIDLMGGSITVNSIEGSGTQFCIDLPLQWRQQQAPTKQVEQPAINHLNEISGHILLVEDHHVNAVVAKGFCEALGFTVDIADNGLIAIQKAKENQYDIILMDNHMPEMNGVDATRFIRDTLGITTLLFAYTADVFSETHDDFIKAGADHVLTKPLRQQNFIDALELFGYRLPNQNKDYQSESHLGQDQLQRHTIEKLSLVEEELSHSEVIHSLSQSPDALANLLKGLVNEFKTSIDDLITFFIAKDLTSLKTTLHATKGIALSFDLPTLANQAREIEEQIKQSKTPRPEQLQRLINRIQLNEHQAQKLIIQYAEQT